MSPGGAVQKGKGAEREVVAMLQAVIDRVYSKADPEDIPQVYRSGYQQSDKGGCDIGGLPWLAVEVKFQAQLSLAAWWAQCAKQAKKNQTPVLFYKVARKGWRIRMAGWIGADEVGVPSLVDIDPEDFDRWFAARLEHEKKV